MPPSRRFSSSHNAARSWARLHGVVSDRFGHLYAESDECLGQLPDAIRGTGRLRHDAPQNIRHLALLAPGKNPGYARILRGWDELAARLVEHHLIVLEADGDWYFNEANNKVTTHSP